MTDHPDSEDPSLEPSADGPTAPPGALEAAVTEVEHYVSEEGWDQSGRLFALVATDELVEAQPDLAIELGVHESTAELLTPVEQEIDQNVRSLEELLTRIAWPSTVAGVVAVVERVVLPPEVERDVPTSRTSSQRLSPPSIRRARTCASSPASCGRESRTPCSG